MGVLIALAIVLTLVRAFLVGMFVVPSQSMEPFLNPGDRILVRLGATPQRGDVIVFDGAGSFTPATPKNLLGSGPLQVALGVDPRDFFVKRVIGVPGDIIGCCTNNGRLTLAGKPVVEPYVFPGDAPAKTSFTVTVPPGQYWVMGDHRDQSSDSRAHTSGPTQGFVPAGAIQGTVTGVLFSIGPPTGSATTLLGR